MSAFLDGSVLARKPESRIRFFHLSVTYSVHKDPTQQDQPVRLALVGLGGHGRTIQHAIAHTEALKVAAVYDPVTAEAEAAAERFGCDAALSYETLLARPDLDAVALVTPNPLHRLQAEAAFAAGLDVFVEKPIANTVADGRAMIGAGQARDHLLMVGHNMRYGRAMRLAHHTIRAGRLGKVVSFEIHFSADNTKRLAPDAWRLRPEACPLLPVMQLGIHAIDLVHYLIGATEAVYAVAQSVTTQPAVTDSVCATLHLETGAAGTLVSNYCTPAFFQLRIAGTEGLLRCTPHQLWFQPAPDADGEGEGPAETHDFRAYDLERSVLQMEAFATSVRHRTRPEVDGWTGLHALAVVEALQQSVETGVRAQVASFPENPNLL